MLISCGHLGFRGVAMVIHANKGQQGHVDRGGPWSPVVMMCWDCVMLQRGFANYLGNLVLTDAFLGEIIFLKIFDPPFLAVLDPGAQNSRCPWTANGWFPMHP